MVEAEPMSEPIREISVENIDLIADNTVGYMVGTQSMVLLV